MKYLKDLNTYLSDLHLMNVKLHNLHWNVVGIDFKQLHIYTEELYDELFIYYDDVAELLKSKGVKPYSTVKEYLENATIKEVSKDEFSAKEVIKILSDDFNALNENVKRLREEADENGDFSTVALLEAHSENYQKQLWFINSMAK